MLLRWLSSKESACKAADERIQSPDQADALEKEKATHFSILAWEIPRTEEPGGVQSTESQRVRHDLATHTHTHTCIYEAFFLPPSLLSFPVCPFLPLFLPFSDVKMAKCKYLLSVKRWLHGICYIHFYKFLNI